MIRRIRKSNDLICFDETLENGNEENSSILANTQHSFKVDKEKRKFVKARRILRNKIEVKDSSSKVSVQLEAASISSLPSPISPSTENPNTNHQTSILTQHLKFNTSIEDVQPSTSGAVDLTSKRRTYELEESVNDISVLKSESEKDSKRINSIPTISDESITPNYSKVTVRKRWDKCNIYSPFPSHDEPNKSSSKIKVPNFAAIHQRALEKVENITEYKERKENRAKMLLSGQKPINQQQSGRKERESRKQLRFAANTVEREPSPTYIPLPTTPFPKSKPYKPPTTPFRNIITPKQNKFEFKMNPFEIKKTPQKHPFSNKVADSVQEKVFKLKNPIVTKKEEFKKCVATKARLEKNAVDSRRCLIKGVRSNRRFELLMNMRKGL